MRVWLIAAACLFAASAPAQQHDVVQGHFADGAAVGALEGAAIVGVGAGERPFGVA